MAGKDRKKELARQRYERQEQARLAREARARRTKIAGAVVAVVVIAAGATTIVAMSASGDDKNKDKGKNNAAGAGATPSTPASAKAGECSYTASQESGALKDKSTPPAKPVYNDVVNATIKTSQGDIGLELDGKKAPCAVNSFAFLAKKKYWDGSHCHRLSTSQGLQMLQCGDPTGSGSGGPGYQFANENTEGAKYTKGTLAMANAGPGTNGSQFFLVYGDSQLSPDYTVFGKITSGIDMLEGVAKAGVAKAGEDGTGEPKKKVTVQDVAIAKK
ncbi:peptidylprolyl isomerase [Actinomadura barringtoniae]|uniref:Peptidyl-prolyl cis-trans isomerase n=1 Tax=Actinomadura barringtoniae TaxID=1427535 RepID=A0A939PIG0_9ACTN|nr:peptidylprolyl isomerase [Actinomadura barringtoniae]MBO2452773.1 peptidylprolyl isomerase [Actinomadura barringtoniae]